MNEAPRAAERTVTSTTAHEPMKKRGERMAFPENASEGFRLLAEEVRLKERKSMLEDLSFMSQPMEGVGLNEDEKRENEERDNKIRDIDNRLGVITTELAKFSDTHAAEDELNRYMNDPKRAEEGARAEKIAATLAEKDRLEEESYVLEGELRLRGQDAETKATLKKTHEARLAAWQQLSDLDPARFQTDAVKEISEAADEAKINALRASINPFTK